MDNDLESDLLSVFTRGFSIPKELSDFEEIISIATLYCVRDYFLEPFAFDRDNITPLDETVEYLWEELSPYHERDLFHYMLRVIGQLATLELANKDYDIIFDQMGYIKEMGFMYDKNFGFTRWLIRTV